MNKIIPRLEWESKYSVGVKVIDDQHQKMFATINSLISTINTMPTKDEVMKIITSLIEYKKFHFATEEKYFTEFNYEGAADHIAQHQEFTKKLSAIQQQAGDDYLLLAFELVDFLEDWLIGHLQTSDRLYIDCFLSHGLK
ncbi:MAG: bacteriohemerythrin [Microgenomates group bacterium]